MKPTVAFILILLPCRLFAQQLNGKIIDKATNKPVGYATVLVGYNVVSASADGLFSLNNIRRGDTITISNMGYKPYKMAFKPGVDTITIRLQQVSIMLQGVLVRSIRDFKRDSLRNRKEFAPVFGYKKTTFKDIFIAQDPHVYVPYDYITSPNTATQIVSVNALSLLSLFTRNKNTTAKLQQELLRDEEDNYVDHAFSKRKIILVTNMHGDSLRDFMTDYRPTVEQVKRMTDYELIGYIKKSYAEFVKSYEPARHIPWISEPPVADKPR